MRLVNRYILSFFRRYFLLSIMAFASLYLIIDFLEKIDKFARNENAVRLCLLYFLNMAPVVLVQMIPLAVLLAVFLAIGTLSRSNELTAIRSGGISLGHVAVPLLGAALAISLLVLATNEFVVPATSEHARYIYNVEVKGKQILATQRGNLWFHNAGQLLHIRLFDDSDQSLHGVIVLGTDENQQLIHRIDAVRAHFDEQGWTLEEATERDFDPSTGEVTSLHRHASLPLLLDKTPEDFLLSQPRPEEMNFWQLKQISETLKNEGFDNTRYQVDLYAKLATPFSSLVMAFFGLPFAIQRGRRSNLAMGIGLSIAVGFLFFIIQTVMQAFGYSATLPPLLSAWGANGIFLLLGFWSLLSTRG